jgi:activator of 2-hydroxyglutaryl-CoA dehydratase
VALLNRVGIEDKFVITGGIARNVGVTTRIEQKLGGLKITIPPEPQLAGAVGAALFALDRTKKHGAEATQLVKQDKEEYAHCEPNHQQRIQ